MSSDCENNEKSYLKEFGKNLRYLRINVAKKSLRIFAYETDVPCATLSRIENGQRIPNIIILKKIASGFNWNVQKLITEIENDKIKEINILDL